MVNWSALFWATPSTLATCAFANSIWVSLSPHWQPHRHHHRSKITHGLHGHRARLLIELLNVAAEIIILRNQRNKRGFNKVEKVVHLVLVVAQPGFPISALLNATLRTSAAVNDIGSPHILFTGVSVAAASPLRIQRLSRVQLGSASSAMSRSPA